MARIQEAKELPLVRVMDEGDIPEKKASPNRSLIIALSVLTAFGAWLCLGDREREMEPSSRGGFASVTGWGS